MIEAMEDAYPISDLCAALDVSRAGFYSWHQRGPSARDRADEALGEEISTLFRRNRRTDGSPRLHRALRRTGHACGRHRVARLMRACGLAGRVHGRRARTTDSHHGQPIAPNRFGPRKAPVERSNEVRASDITYVPTDEGWLYLAGVLDLGSRRVVGWAMGDHLETSLPVDALRMALSRRQPFAGLLHHLDRGCQYASEAYREPLAAWNVTPGRSRKGQLLRQRRHGELQRVRSRKNKVHRRAFTSRSEAAGAIFDDIETFYHRERLHSAPGFISPVEFEKQSNLN